MIDKDKQWSNFLRVSSNFLLRQFGVLQVVAHTHVCNKGLATRVRPYILHWCQMVAPVWEPLVIFEGKNYIFVGVSGAMVYIIISVKGNIVNSVHIRSY